MAHLLQQKRKGKTKRHPTRQSIPMCNKSKATNHTNQIGSVMKFWHLSKPKRKRLASLDTIGARDKFEIVVTKWNKILAKVMNLRFSIQMRNGVTCKDKWGVIARD